jgi:hypothetical protein
MKETSASENKRGRAACPKEAAFPDLLGTTDLLSRGLVQVLQTEDLSATLYNVLRILRGAPKGLACGEIAGGMITRDPMSPGCSTVWRSAVSSRAAVKPRTGGP